MLFSFSSEGWVSSKTLTLCTHTPTHTTPAHHPLCSSPSFLPQQESNGQTRSYSTRSGSKFRRNPMRQMLLFSLLLFGAAAANGAPATEQNVVGQDDACSFYVSYTHGSDSAVGENAHWTHPGIGCYVYRIQLERVTGPRSIPSLPASRVLYCAALTCWPINHPLSAHSL